LALVDRYGCDAVVECVAGKWSDTCNRDYPSHGAIEDRTVRGVKKGMDA
jgi:hypothetical protein